MKDKERRNKKRVPNMISAITWHEEKYKKRVFKPVMVSVDMDEILEYTKETIKWVDEVDTFDETNLIKMIKGMK